MLLAKEKMHDIHINVETSNQNFRKLSIVNCDVEIQSKSRNLYISQGSCYQTIFSDVNSLSL